ncbi:MAG: hypothetical protein FJW39_12525 [Acidobacteria bacterium]|nr:hypothetical protein [Acidobacteriota bacterium]
MKILVFSDIHGDLPALARLMEIEADLYFAAGDLVNWSRGLDKVAPVMAPKKDRVYVLPGNHESPDVIWAFCQRYGFRDFHGNAIEAAGVHIAGLGCSSPTPFDTPGEYTEEQFEAKLEPFRGKNPLVMICHCPPKNTELDRAGPGRHYGSEAIGRFLSAEQPAYFFCGHVHEAWGAEVKLGPTHAVNVGKRGYLLDLSQVR